VEALVERLASVLERGDPPDRLVVVARGGLVPGGLLAGRLDVACVEVVRVRAYDGRARRHRPEVLGPVPAAAGPSGDPTRTLVFDELVESGATLGAVAAHLPLARRAVLLVKGAPGAGTPPGLVEVPALASCPGGARACVADVVPADRWVVFPWTPARER
jgi:hypoxanthine phosphoribosyltransferase